MKWILIIAGVLLVIVILIYVVGLALPEKHTATIRGNISATPQQVWERITDVDKFTNWRRGLKEVIIINENEWKEVGDNGTIPMKGKEKLPAAKLVSMINSKELPFGGEWVYELQPDGNNTILTITENGEIYNPFFRFVSRFIIGRSSTMKQYIEDLKKSFQ